MQILLQGYREVLLSGGISNKNNLASFTYEKIAYSILICLSFVFGSCDKSTDDTSKVTYFVTLERLGDTKIVLEKGQPYVEPGYYAEMNGEDITSSVEIKGNVDVNTPGIYNLVYAAYNEDGFAKTFTRTVYVADNTPSPLQSGIYTLAEGSKRTVPSVVAFSGYEIVIFQIEPGIFYITDFLGGWYDQRTGYGPDYAMVGKFELNEDNTITPIESYVAGWGDSMDQMTNTSLDPATGTLRWSIDYAGQLSFDIIVKNKNMIMKKYMILLLASLAFTVVACDDDTEPGGTAIEKWLVTGGLQ